MAVPLAATSRVHRAWSPSQRATNRGQIPLRTKWPSCVLELPPLTSIDQNWVQIKAQICNAQFPGNNYQREIEWWPTMLNNRAVRSLTKESTGGFAAIPGSHKSLVCIKTWTCCDACDWLCWSLHEIGINRHCIACCIDESYSSMFFLSFHFFPLQGVMLKFFNAGRWIELLNSSQLHFLNFLIHLSQNWMMGIWEGHP